LIGNEVKVGEKAPDFTALDNALTPVQFSSYRGKICILSSVPSLDTRFVISRQGDSMKRLAAWAQIF